MVSTTGKVSGKALQTGGKVAVQTGKTAWQISEKAAQTGGQAVKTGIQATGSLAKTGAKNSAAVLQVPLVTLKDTATGAVKQVPWTEGLKLYAASKQAEFQTYGKAFAIFRQQGATVFRTDWRRIQRGEPEPVLLAGDMVEFSNARSPNKPRAK